MVRIHAQVEVCMQESWFCQVVEGSVCTTFDLLNHQIQILNSNFDESANLKSYPCHLLLEACALAGSVWLAPSLLP